MVNLKFKEVDDRFGTPWSMDCVGLLVRKFLRIEEIDAIVEELLKEENLTQREVTKYVMLAKMCTNIDFDKMGDMNDLSAYNLMTEYGIIEDIDGEVLNFYKVDKLVKEYESTGNFIKGLVSSIMKLEKINELLGDKNE